ncbi:sensor histidine kinase [Leptothoe sp. PORK10 BA2]|uniref:sensor histidine kinase n=1 Tax=Leptothoe sp. PORK10 BA2 TaxID=3110254 RepID=UPI002B1FC8D7|nr:ATP-binding protein [Leptothoe sp. PORK10 BA2]MEA5466231.1 ATP-binding protein [Leptothoe sp. PORK10 BA2]
MAEEKIAHTVLIIHGSEAERKIYRHYLQQDPHCRYHITAADCATQNIERRPWESFDAILLDLPLSQADGLQELNVLKEQQSETAIIVLTDVSREHLAIQAIEHGAHDYLIKDQLSQEVFQRTVRSRIKHQQLQNQLQTNQKRQDLITQLTLNIQQSLLLDETLNTTVKGVRQLLGCDRVLAYRFSPDMSGTIIAESVQPDYRSTLGQTVRDSYFQDQGAQEYCQGRIQWVDDIYRANLDRCHIKLLEQFEVRAILATPILLQEGSTNTPRLWGLLVAHQCSRARVWIPDETKLLETLSLHIAIAIQQAQLLEKTQTALEKAKALSAFKSKILTTISHEYNTPLTAIKAAAETLRVHANSLSSHHRDRYLAIIEYKAKYLSVLVKDMLLANQADLDQLQLQPMEINLENLFSKLIDEHRGLATNQHHISLTSLGNIENFVGDLGLLQQVFENLLSNAIKYSPGGGDIQLVIVGEANQITCHVNDEGMGILEADLPHLFEVFRRGSNVGEIPGTGLGLNIVKAAVELHGGNIVVKSKQGKGTRIRVELPKTPKEDVTNNYSLTSAVIA